MSSRCLHESAVSVKSILSLVGWLALGLTAAARGQAPDRATSPHNSTEALLSMPEPPVGYVVTNQPITIEEKIVGFQVLVMKEGAVSKVMITIETKDRSDRGVRVAVCKGYINGFVSGLAKQGVKLTTKEIPDIEKSDFKTPVVVDLTFANAEGTFIHVRKRMFFTTKGYDVTVIATDENELKMLSNWAGHIQPAATSAQP
jgi:hypothetical protein